MLHTLCPLVDLVMSTEQKKVFLSFGGLMEEGIQVKQERSDQYSLDGKHSDVVMKYLPVSLILSLAFLNKENTKPTFFLSAGHFFLGFCKSIYSMNPLRNISINVLIFTLIPFIH